MSLHAPALGFLERSQGIGAQELFEGAVLLVALHGASLPLFGRRTYLTSRGLLLKIS